MFFGQMYHDTFETKKNTNVTKEVQMVAFYTYFEYSS